MRYYAYFRDFVHGIIMGLTSAIPGVSFGSVAILLNNYEKILNSAASWASIKKNQTYLGILCVGSFCGIFLFSKLATFLLAEYEMIKFFCFIGMIIGCTPMIYRRAKFDKVNLQNKAIFVLAFAFMVFWAYMSKDSSANQTLAQLGGISPSLLVWIFASGFIGAMAMIVPGISGSIVLLMLGAYTVIFEGLSTLNIAIVAATIAGMILGIMAGIKLVNKLLQFCSQAVYSAILGLILGSVLIIFPGFSWNAEGLIAITCGLICMTFIYFFSKNN